MPYWASLDDLNRLVVALENIGMFGDVANRNNVVDWVDSALRAEDPDVRLDPQRAANQRADLIGIVTAVLNRPHALSILEKAVILLAPGQPATDEFRNVCEEVGHREPVLLGGGDRASLFDALAGLTPDRDVTTLLAEAIAPMPVPAEPGTLRAAVLRLERRTSPVPLFRFLELLAASATESDSAAVLRQWIDVHLFLVPPGRRPELTSLRQQLVNGPTLPDERPSLEIRMEPVDEDRFSVLAWISPGGSTTANSCGPEDTVTRAGVRTWLGHLLDRYAGTVLAPKRGARIDFILPTSHLNEAVDGWEVTYGGDAHRLGAQYRVVIRPDTRSPEGAERLSHRWKITSRVIATEHRASDVVEWLASTSNADLWTRLDQDRWAWLAITCQMMAQTGAAVSAVVETGTPVALWVRGDRPDTVRQQVLVDVSQARQVDELPDSVWAFRKLGWAGSDDVRRDLVLLWDDPTRPPPDRPTLVAPRPQGVATR